jgi:site-specific DNA-methyltransferase (adenine-specific)
MIDVIEGNASSVSLWPKTRKTKILLTDPPYGINMSWKKQWHGNNGKSTLRNGAVPTWDKNLIDLNLLNNLIAWSDIAIIWGGNNYCLPQMPFWMIWDKLQSNRGSDAEMAWTNAPLKGHKVFRMSRIDAYFNKRIFPKKHICEKPIQLMVWCLEQLKLKDAFVFDPFVGSGSSMVAAFQKGFDGLGIDIDKTWVAETKERIKHFSGGKP